MCIDDGCDELLCCLCAPLAAIFCCKICKDKVGSNNVNQAPESAIFQSDGRIPAAGIYGPQGYGPSSQNQMRFYPGGPQPYYPSQQQPPNQGNYFPPRHGYARNDLPSISVRQQPRPY